MSRTIITNSGSNFWTNINSEQMLGELCKEVGAKFYEEKYPDRCYSKLAYSMTKEEANFASNGLKTLAEKIEDIYPKYKPFLGKEVTPSDFKSIILEYADDFEKSGGYECI